MLPITSLQITDYALPITHYGSPITDYASRITHYRSQIVIRGSESPVREMVKELKEFGIEVFGYDPLLSKEEIEAFGVNALNELNVKVDCVIVAVAHDEFKKMELDEIKKFMNDAPVLIDVRRMFDGEDAKGKGLYYKTL